MNLKRNVVFFTIFICIFFSISCVVAGDVNDSGMATHENQVTNDVNGELITSSHEDLVSGSSGDNGTAYQGNLVSSGSGDKADACQGDLVSSGSVDKVDASQKDIVSSKSGDGTFTELQLLINATPIGGTLNLNKDYTYDKAFNSSKGIVISKSMTINGNGHTLDALSKSRILYIINNPYLKTESKVTLNNIVFKNGNAKYYGGAILNLGNLTVNNCVFEKNYAGTSAGAICSICALNCKNSVFNKNSAGGSAGAIFSLSAENSTKIPPINPYDIDENTVIQFLMKYYNLKPLTDYITNCKFTNNVANGRGGGAVYAYTHIKIVSSTFTSNSAKEVGGAVYANKNLCIKYSTFSFNKVSKYGGAVYFRFHEISGHYDKNGKWKNDLKFYTSLIKNCFFNGNVANGRGGAIYVFKYSKKPKLSGSKVLKCTFSDNRASKGNEIYGGTLVKCAIKNTRIALKTVDVKKSAKRIVLVAKFKQGSKLLKHKKVTFVFNGNVYKVKTNSKGYAKAIVKSKVLKKLKVGNKVKYKARYNGVTAKKSARVMG